MDLAHTLASHARLTGVVCAVTLFIGLGLAPAAHSQASDRAVFVANNGNLEGSVTAFRVSADGTLALINRIVTGTRPTMSDPCPGCNPYEITIAPGGRYVATGHAAGSDPLEQVSIFEVAADGSIEQAGAFPVPGTPMDVVWIDDTFLAVLRTDPSPDKVVVYRFDPSGPSLTEVDIEDVGSFSMYLAMHPTQRYLYVNDSGTARLIRVFQVALDGTLTLVDTEPTGTYYGLELMLTRDATKLYAAGGITSAVLGYAVAPDGALSPMAGSPFPEVGDSPSNLCSSVDDHYLLVGHGTDATLRSAAIDPLTGGLAYTGFVFDVGLQGTLGDIAVLDALVFVTDNSTAIDGLMGIYSFTLGDDGAFVQNAPICTTQGIAPRSIAVWDESGSGSLEGPIGAGDRAGTRAGFGLLISPNPCCDTADIAYRNPAAGEVAVDVLDVGGRVVRGLLARTQTAGEHRIRWDGVGEDGRALPAGIYFARVRTAAGEALARVVIVR